MPIHKEDRFFDKNTKRLMIKITCDICNEERISRYDHIKERYFDKRKSIRCKKCSKVKILGFKHKSGYIIRHYRSFSKEYWNILKDMCKNNGQITEHRAILAISIARPLKNNEIVHHKNGIVNDNRIENLELCLVRQPMGQRVNDLIEENRFLRLKLEQNGICL